MMESPYEIIKQRIVLLDLKPGEALNLKALAKELGVSATPIREALIRLEVDGLVRRVPNSTAYVTEVRFQDLKDVFEVRVRLVEQIGELAAQRVTEDEIVAMEGLLDQMKEETDRKTLIQLDSAFHNLINQATKNQALAKVANLLRNQVMRFWFFIEDDSSYWPMVRDGRERVLNALMERDTALSKEILRNHVVQFVEQLKETMVGRAS